MGDELLANAERELLRLRTDFPYYARNILKITTKVGGIEPLTLNAAQTYIHARIEDQLKRTGKVRMLILKGRQQGACLDPRTPVLTGDLRWVPIEKLKVGDKVIAVDEHHAKGKGGARKMRTAAVEKIWMVRKEAYRMTFDDGRSVVCSGEHRWLSRKSAVQPRWRSINGADQDKANLRVGDMIRSVTEPWGEPTVDDAWFGGVIDGEGCLNQKGPTGCDVTVSQCEGAVLSKMLDVCEQRGYGHYIVSDDGPRKTKFGGRAVHAVTISAMRHMFRLLGLSRPVRFIGQPWWEGRRLPANGWRTIVSIEPLGERRLIDIQTTTQTFIAQGLVSHNSTYTEGRCYWKASGHFGQSVKIITHSADSTATLFKMTRMFHDESPPYLKPATRSDSAHSLEFHTLKSHFSVATAGSKEAGRGDMARMFHGSEVAFWPDPAAIMRGIGQIVPNAPGTEIILESTANGVGNYFYNAVMRALSREGEYELIFVPWMWQTEYTAEPPKGWRPDHEGQQYADTHKLTLGQSYWRYLKIKDDFDDESSSFDQEYPATVALAFRRIEGDVFIPLDYIERAMKSLGAQSFGPKILGVDPAEYGPDSTAIIGRQGRNARLHFKRLHGWGQMQVAGYVGRVMDEGEYDACNIDVTGGYGGGIADRLIENGYNVNRIGFGESAIDSTKYPRRADEMWGAMKDWLKEGPVAIPNEPIMQIDLSMRQFKYDSSRRTVLESKEAMRTRGLKSPDSADALALTFAMPVKKAKQPPRQHAYQGGDMGY